MQHSVKASLSTHLASDEVFLFVHVNLLLSASSSFCFIAVFSTGLKKFNQCSKTVVPNPGAADRFTDIFYLHYTPHLRKLSIYKIFPCLITLLMRHYLRVVWFSFNYSYFFIHFWTRKMKSANDKHALFCRITLNFILILESREIWFCSSFWPISRSTK